ncbi:Zinc finger nanos-type [Trinorchestia longiramus]|nr:Zinc finger nanos-type [Trinorchestia longiramus]
MDACGLNEEKSSYSESIDGSVMGTYPRTVTFESHENRKKRWTKFDLTKCRYCMTAELPSTHGLYNTDGDVVCKVLSRYQCTFCIATGAKAHMYSEVLPSEPHLERRPQQHQETSQGHGTILSSSLGIQSDATKGLTSGDPRPETKGLTSGEPRSSTTGSPTGRGFHIACPFLTQVASGYTETPLLSLPASLRRQQRGDTASSPAHVVANTTRLTSEDPRTVRRTALHLVNPGTPQQVHQRPRLPHGLSPSLSTTDNAETRQVQRLDSASTRPRHGLSSASTRPHSLDDVTKSLNATLAHTLADGHWFLHAVALRTELKASL